MALDPPASPAPQRLLGPDGRALPPLAYGCWRFAGATVAEARARIEAALEAGLTLIDTADIYGFGGPGVGAAEELLGEVLRADPGLRDRMLLATKGGIRPPVPYDSSAATLRAAVDASRRRLGVDVIDLWQVHRPDVLTHPAEVAAALVGMVESGAVGAVGVSNHTPHQYDTLRRHLADTPVRIVSTQPELHALHLAAVDDGTLDLATRDDLVTLAWSPLAGGRLGDGVVATDAREAAVHAVLDELAARHAVARSAVALAWVMRHPARPVPIVGSNRPERIRASADALRVDLDRAEWYAVARAAGRPQP